jgi:AraC family transcriptional activator of pobA
MSGNVPVPSFYLYGEPHRSAVEGFVHVESLDDRSRANEWTIQPHAHPELGQIFHVAFGGGEMQVDGGAIPFSAPCLLLVPTGMIHGFAWQAESRGAVVTLASSYIAELTRRDEAMAALFRLPCVAMLEAGDGAVLDRSIHNLARELGWSAPGHRAAVDAALLSIIVVLLRRARAPQRQNDTVDGHYAEIVARLRERIEQRFRLREPVGAHAAALGVSVTTLRLACARVAGLPPALMLDQRALLEARRALLYSTLTIAEIGYAVGFADPAYFSRFFTRHTGQPPRQYRLARGRAT